MKCQFCSEEQKEWDRKQVAHITASINENGDGHNHLHLHGNFDNRIVAEDVVDSLIDSAHLSDLFRKGDTDKLAGITEVIFHNRQRIGDMFMFTCGVRDFKAAHPRIKVNVISTCAHIWDHNPAIDRTIQPWYKDGVTLETAKPEDFLNKRTNVLKIGPGRLTNASNRLDWHFANAFRLSIEEALGIHIPQGNSWADIYFTEEEYNAPRITEKPYWIVVTGGEKGWGCKMYPTKRWQEVVDQNPEITFYQLGASGDNHERLRGPNVVDYIGKTEDGKTGLRDLLKLFLNAEGSIGLVSFHMHLSGALRKPCVVVAGGREPVSFTRYAGHQYIANDGCLPCSVTACWHCDIKSCTNLVTVGGEEMPKCVDLIPSEEVTRYLRRYYDGGRLSLHKPSDKPKVNVVKASTKKDSPHPIPFGGGALTEQDWEFISSTIDKHGVTSVLEFGSGLSTLLLTSKVKDVVSYETSQRWVDRVNAIKPCDIRLWDGSNLDLGDRRFSLAFVDGPSGGASRKVSTRIAAEHADIVVVHDAGRENEKRWQDLYLKDKFDGPGKGGHRCHLWIRKPEMPKIVKLPRATKTVKLVSTARGWGGCARSITTMMNMLLKAGHSVEFIPFRNAVSSHEFAACIKSDMPQLKVTLDYSTLKDPCDTLVVYADDYVWEFGKPEVADWFSEAKADKKIMVLNYRRGPVGQAEWTKGWDRYLFLNHTQEEELLKLLPEASTGVLSPCTDLSPFLAQKVPTYSDYRLLRHSSQGDTKYDRACNYEYDLMLDTHNDLTIHLMPGPSWCQQNSRIILYPRNTPPIPQFLTLGNLFWYSLPEGYMDMGPRVILEAMAVGLPVLADNWGGAKDRVTKETGWLCDTKRQMAKIVQDITPDQLSIMGRAAKEHAAQNFVAERWLDEIVG